MVCHHPTFRFRKKRGFISYYRQRLQLNSVRCDFTVFHQDMGLNPTSLTSLAARWPCQLCRSVPPSSVLCCPLIPHFSPPSKSDHWAWGTLTTLAQAHLRASASRVSVPWIAVIKEAKLSPEGGASSAVLSRNFSIVLASRSWGDGLPQTSRSLGNYSSFTLLLKTLALWQCYMHPSSSLMPITDIASIWWFSEVFPTWLTALLVTDLSHFLRCFQWCLWWSVRHLSHQLLGPLFSMDLVLCLRNTHPLSLPEHVTL